MTRATIKASEWYTLKDIATREMFPWCKSYYRSIRNLVDLDKKNQNILKGTTIGLGTQKRYHFKGENIIKFINLFEAGKIQFSKTK